MGSNGSRVSPIESRPTESRQEITKLTADLSNRVKELEEALQIASDNYQTSQENLSTAEKDVC